MQTAHSTEPSPCGSDNLQGTRIDKDKAVQMAQTSYHVVLRGRLEVYAVLLYYTQHNTNKRSGAHCDAISKNKCFFAFILN